MNERKINEEINFLLKLDYKNVYTGTLRNPRMKSYISFSEINKKFIKYGTRTTLSMTYKLYRKLKLIYTNSPKNPKRLLVVEYSNVLDIINSKRNKIKNGK